MAFKRTSYYRVFCVELVKYFNNKLNVPQQIFPISLDKCRNSKIISES